MAVKERLAYRVETEDGAGPYNGYLDTDAYQTLKQRLGDEHCDSEHPTPTQDLGLARWPDYEEHCGFTSLAAMREWFRGFGQLLTEAGFRVAVYRLPREDVTPGDKQALLRLGGYRSFTPFKTFDPAFLID